MGGTNIIAKSLLGGMKALPKKYSERLRVKFLLHLKNDFPDIFLLNTSFGELRLLSTEEGWVFAGKYAHGSPIESETVDWIQTYIKAGDEMWDIGANIGIYSLCAAISASAKVRAFEPFFPVFDNLIGNIALNEQQEKIFVYPLALAEKTSLGALYKGGPFYKGAFTFVQEGETPPSFCQNISQASIAFSIDDFHDIFKIKPPAHIKLDVDGLEMDILRGAAKTLPQVKSVMVEVEGDFAKKADLELIPFLKQFGLLEKNIIGEQSGRNRLFLKS